MVGTGVNAAAAGAPTISGTPTPGATLTCGSETWTSWAGLQPSLSAESFDGYQWLANGSPIAGATASTYVPTGGNVGQQLSCRVMATYSSLATTAVNTSAPIFVGLPPSSTSPPGITGTAVAGQTVTEVHGGWANTPTLFSYQWQLCNSSGASCSSIADATGQTYVIPSSDAGLSLRVVETTANQYGTSAPGTSGADAIASLPSPKITKVAFTGSSASVSVDCSGAAEQTCSGTYTVTTQEHLKGKTIVAVTASAKPKETSKTVMIASGSYHISSDKTSTIKVSLNKTGKSLLTRFYKVAASLKITGHKTATKSVTFSYTVIKSPVNFTWVFSPKFTLAQELSVAHIPSKGKVEAICHGGGCPFGSKGFAPKHGSVNVATGLGEHHLTPGATLEIEVTAPDDVGKVVEFTIESGREPSIKSLCLPPGDSKPAACA